MNITEHINSIITATNGKQPTLVSGTNIKTLNGNSILGSGDISVSSVSLSGIAAYHIYNGNLALADSVITNGFGTVLYTGNGSTQSINTGIDMNTQWGDSADEKFGGLIWIKSRSAATNNFLFDTIRGIEKEINTNTAEAEATLASSLTAFTSTGMTLGSAAGINVSAATYASWNFQTTHRTSGVTNHGKAYTCHYNPYTGFTIVKYEGSGLAGHEIPHHLGRKLGFVQLKNLVTNSTAGNWDGGHIITKNRLFFNSTATGSGNIIQVDSTDNSIIVSENPGVNDITNNCTYILYGWANSYFDEDNTLIGNYEIGIYQGTGAAGNKVTTRGKPAWVMIKRLDSTGDWFILDNLRGASLRLSPNLADIENAIICSFEQNSFTFGSSAANVNVANGQYLYMVAYDNDGGSGKSKYPKPSDNPTLNLNAIVPLADGIDSNGSKTTLKVLNETVTGVTLTAGKNYIYRTDTGYGVSTNPPSYGKENPLTGDFFNLITLKWYNSSNVEIESRNYLDAIVHADHTGNATYVEQLPKTYYFDEVKANEYKGKNACTAWAILDTTTTPVKIIDSYNINKVIRTATGKAKCYFEQDMNYENYSIVGTCLHGNLGNYDGNFSAPCDELPTVKSFTFATSNSATVLANSPFVYIQIFGGK